MVVSKYQKRTPEPLLDRIDIHMEVPGVEYEKLSDARTGEPSVTTPARVEVTRQRQLERFSNKESSNPVTCNAAMRPPGVRKFCLLDETGRALMQMAMK